MAGNLDDIFAQEFKQMMQMLKANGLPSLSLLPLSEEIASKCTVSKTEKVLVKNIEDEVFSRLNNTVCLLWTRPDLKRHKFDSKGKWITKPNKDGKDEFVYENITLPHHCVALVSDKPIGVKTKYKSKEDFIYVDMISQKVDGIEKHKYVYVVPRKYCFRIKQTALVASWGKMTRQFYKGVKVATSKGGYLHLFIMDYKYTSSDKNYRVLCTGTNPDGLEEITNEILKYWVKVGFMFNPANCEVYGEKLDVSNLALQPLDGTIDSYTLCSPRALDNESDIDYSYEFFEEDTEEE